MNKIIVYTANFGDKDSIKPVGRKEKGVDYICFTDNPRGTPKSWESIQTCSFSDSPRRTARWLKANPHILFPEHEYSIWVDGRVSLKKSVKSLLKLLKPKNGQEKELAVSKHPDRDCIYDEADVCKEFGLEKENNINYLINEIRLKGYPEHNGLSETAILVRKNTNKIRAFNINWSNIVVQTCIRDQLSFNYLLWALKIDYENIPTSYFNKGKHARSE